MSELIGIMGTTALLVDGRFSDAWGTPRQRAFLGALVLNVGKPVTVGQLVDWMWPQDAPLPQRPAATLDNLATKVRKSLARLPTVAVLSGRNGRYRLDVDHQVIDYHRFRSLVSESRRSADPRAAVEAATAAVGLWRGGFLDDLSSHAVEAMRATFEHNELIPARADLVDALLAADRCDDALGQIDGVQAEHPLHVRLAKLRLTTLHRLGRHEDQTAYYMTTRRMMRTAGDDDAADDLREHQDGLRTHRSLPARRRGPSTLPHDNPDFSGRADLLAELDAAATAADGALLRGVVVLHGMAGVGKTALAIHWGHRVRHRFSGDIFVSLNGFSGDLPAHHDAVVDELLTTLGQHLDDKVPARAREVMLRERLAGRHTLVVLDNARDTAQVRNLVPLLSDCLVVVTSRQGLTTLSLQTGGRRVAVPPMSAAESGELIAARLGRGAPADRLAGLCGGLPLVISLATGHIAAHRDVWPPERLPPSSARRLLLALDGDGDGDGAISPQTVFGWSYRAQSDRDQRLFRRLALLPGGEFGLETATACAGLPPDDTRAGLVTLAGAHLIERRGDRYGFHDLLRDYAALRMSVDEPAETEPAHRRVLAYYLAGATQAHRTLYPNSGLGPGLPGQDEIAVEPIVSEADAEAWFQREHATITAVIDLAARGGHHGYAWRIAHAVSMYLGRHGFHVECLAVRQAAVTAARADGHVEAEAASLSDLGLAHLAFGDIDEAFRCFSVAKRYADETGSLLAGSRVCLNLGRVEIQRGYPHAAVGILRESLNAARDIDDQMVLCWGNIALGDALGATSRPDEALRHLYQAQYYAERLNDRSALAKSLAGMGAVHQDRGDYPTAAAHCDDALRIAREVSDPHMVAKIHVALAVIHYAANAQATAERHARAAVAVATDSNDVLNRAAAFDALGATLYVQGEAAEAEDAWRQALDLYDRMKEHRRAAMTQARLDELPTGGVFTRRPVKRPHLDPRLP